MVAYYVQPVDIDQERLQGVLADESSTQVKCAHGKEFDSPTMRLLFSFGTILG